MAKLDLLVKVAVQGARDLDTLSGRMNSAGASLTRNVTLPLVAAGAAFTTMAADAEQSQAKLESVFDSMGASAFTSIDALNAHAEAMANSTTFDDDAVKEAQAVLLTFGEITGEAFTGATESAADLAAFFETDMNDAALVLGKALQDPVDGLSRLGRQGIIFSEEQKAAVAAMVEAGDTAGAQALILAEVQGQVGQVAEDLAATSGGQMTQAMNQLGEAGEALGTFLLPALTGLAGALKTLAGIFTSMPAPVQGAVVAFAAFAALAGPILGMAANVSKAFGIIKSGFLALKLVLLANPFVALAAAAVALVALIVLNWDKIVEVFQGALRFISDTGKKLWTPISKGFGAAIDFIKGIWNAFARWWNSIEIAVPSIDIPFVGKVGGFSIGLPDLPYLAAGGIVTSPTLAMIGEAGPEAVVPLDKLSGLSPVTVEVNVLGDVRADDDEAIARTISRVLWVQGLSDRVLTNG